MTYFCCDQQRRNVVKQQSVFNGIDFLEVSDDPAAANEQRQRMLLLHFVNEFAGNDPANTITRTE